MDAIRLVCPECDAVHRVKNITLGKLYRCKKCKSGLITMQPAVLVCPACGATRSPAHIEVSRLVTCDECEQSPVMQVRIAGVTLGEGLYHEDDASASESAVSDSTIITDKPEPENAANKRHPMESEISETPTAPLNPENSRPADAESAFSEDLDSEALNVPLNSSAPRVTAQTGMDTAIIRKIIAEAAPEPLADTPESEEFTPAEPEVTPESAPAALATSAPTPAPSAERPAALYTEEYSGSVPVWAQNLDDGLRGIYRRLEGQRLSVFSRPVFAWICLAVLFLLYGWLLSSVDTQNTTVKTLQNEIAAVRADRARQEKRIAELENEKRALQTEQGKLENDLRVYFNKLNEKQREINMLNKAYNNQFGGPEIK